MNKRTLLNCTIILLLGISYGRCEFTNNPPNIEISGFGPEINGSYSFTGIVEEPSAGGYYEWIFDEETGEYTQGNPIMDVYQVYTKPDGSTYRRYISTPDPINFNWYGADGGYVVGTDNSWVQAYPETLLQFMEGTSQPLPTWSITWNGGGIGPAYNNQPSQGDVIAQQASDLYKGLEFNNGQWTVSQQ